MMSVKVLTFLCIQAFLLQNAFSQLNGYGTIANHGFANVGGYSTYDPMAATGMAPVSSGITYNTPANMVANTAYGANLMPMGESMVIPSGMSVNLATPINEYGETYGGSGIGDIMVAGEMPVGGTTIVTGQVPILGSVRFGGDVSARGVITVSGTCGCGCGTNNMAPTWVAN